MNYESCQPLRSDDAPGFSAYFDRWCDNPDSWDITAAIAAYKGPCAAKIQGESHRREPNPDRPPGKLDLVPRAHAEASLPNHVDDRLGAAVAPAGDFVAGETERD